MSDVERLLKMADDLRFLADHLQINADWAKQSKERNETTQQQEEKPVKHTLEEVRGVLGSLSAKGYTKRVKDLIGKYGADKLSDIPGDKYESLLKEAEELSHE